MLRTLKWLRTWAVVPSGTLVDLGSFGLSSVQAFEDAQTASEQVDSTALPNWELGKEAWAASTAVAVAVVETELVSSPDVSEECCSSVLTSAWRNACPWSLEFRFSKDGLPLKKMP